jgi:hypothetical protein
VRIQVVHDWIREMRERDKGDKKLRYIKEYRTMVGREVVLGDSFKSIELE